MVCEYREDSKRRTAGGQRQEEERAKTPEWKGAYRRKNGPALLHIAAKGPGRGQDVKGAIDVLTGQLVLQRGAMQATGSPATGGRPRKGTLSGSQNARARMMTRS